MATLALATELAVLVMSGVVLFFVYRPDGVQPWAGTEVPDASIVSATRALHRVASWAAVLTSALLVLALVAARRWASVALAAGVVVAVVAGAVSGDLLAWDQLALWAVTAVEDLGGFRPLLGDAVRFVIVDGVEVGRATFLGQLLFHLVVPTAGTGALLAVLQRQWRRRSSSVD